MSLQRRRERYCMIHVYKILNKLAPNDINMNFYHSERRGACCKLPPLVKNSKAKYQKKYDDSFPVIGAKLWNLLPKKIKVKKSLFSFKSALSKYITQVPDHPPVPGIASDNSLLCLLASDRSSWRNSQNVGGWATSYSDEDSDEDSEEDDVFLMA